MSEHRVCDNWNDLVEGFDDGKPFKKLGERAEVESRTQTPPHCFNPVFPTASASCPREALSLDPGGPAGATSLRDCAQQELGISQTSIPEGFHGFLVLTAWDIP